MTAAMFYGLAALALAVLVLWGARRVGRPWLAWPLAWFGAFGFLLGLVVLTWSVVAASGDRSPRSVEFGASLVYERTAVDEPHRQVVHIAVVDLDNPCVGLVTTRPGQDGLVVAETATEFVERTGVALSINVAFFYPFDEYPYWSAYPRSGDKVTAIGPVVIDGEWLGDVDNGGNLGLALTDGRLSVGPIPADADLAVRGRTPLIVDGQVVAPESEAYPRAVVGVDVDANLLVLVVSDGKQPGYAEGSTFRQVAELLIGLGVDQAIEFDGGGSATMAGMVDGRVELLSRPSHQRLPGRQRPVASHLGITIDTDCP